MAAAAVVVVGLGAGVSGPAEAGQPPQAGARPAQAAAPAAPARASAKAATRRADVDGDGRRDLVTLSAVTVRADRNTYHLTVRTAAGRVSSVLHSAYYPGQEGRMVEPGFALLGTAPVDGVRGNDIGVDQYGSEDCLAIRVYTWRKGRLAVLPSPQSRRNATWSWCIDDVNPSGIVFGYSGKQRRVTLLDLNFHPELSGYVTGRQTVYAWTPTGWRQVSSTKVNAYPRDRAKRYVGLNGLKFS